MLRCFVLNNLKGSDACALFPAPAQEQTAVTRGPESDCACGREIGFGIKVFGDPHGVLDDGGANVVAGIDIDAAMNQLSCSGPVMTAGFVQGFADEV